MNDLLCIISEKRRGGYKQKIEVDRFQKILPIAARQLSDET